MEGIGVQLAKYSSNMKVTKLARFYLGHERIFYSEIGSMQENHKEAEADWSIGVGTKHLSDYQSV